METTACKIDGCKQPYRAKGYCESHFKKWRRGELPHPRYKTCAMEGCRKKRSVGGLCDEHHKAVAGGEAKATAAPAADEKKEKAPEAPAAEEKKAVPEAKPS